jgi:hypothetical protein
MATKERYQNPVVSDTIKLRLHTFNYQNAADLVEIEKIDIYFLDPEEKSESNPDGRRLVESIDGGLVTREDTGQYLVEVELTGPQYVIGQYFDVWTAKFTDEDSANTSPHPFQIYPNLWYTTPIPVVYDFSFHFQPNRVRRGSKQYIMIEIRPNVPNATDLQRYYENLAIVADLKISIEQSACSDCAPAESDLRLIVDEEAVDYRERRWGYYKLDTEDMDTGLFDVWFRLDFGDNTYLSDKMQLLIYE